MTRAKPKSKPLKYILVENCGINEMKKSVYDTRCEKKKRKMEIIKRKGSESSQGITNYGIALEKKSFFL